MFTCLRALKSTPACAEVLIKLIFVLFGKDYFLRTVVYCVLGNNYIVEADAAGVQRVAPLMVVAVPPAKGCNRNPAVNKQRIQQQIHPGLEGSADFPQYRYRENILADTNQSPNLYRIMVYRILV